MCVDFMLQNQDFWQFGGADSLFEDPDGEELGRSVGNPANTEEAMSLETNGQA